MTSTGPSRVERGTTSAAAVDGFGLEVRLGLAMVPGFAPVGWDAASYERHLEGVDALPEVQAWHVEHWPDVATFAAFGARLDLHGWSPRGWADLASAAGAGRLRAVATDHHRDWAGEIAEVTDAAGVLGLDPARTPAGTDPASVPPTAGAAAPSVTTGPSIVRGLGPSSTWNQVETDDDRLDAAGIVDLLTGVVAREGSVTLQVGPAPDGSIPAAIASPLRAAGAWVAAHYEALADVSQFDVWGDEQIRYTSRPGIEPGTRTVYVIDLVGTPVREIAHLSPHRYPIETVEGAADWRHGPAGLQLVANPRKPGGDSGRPPATVYRLGIRTKRARLLAVTGERSGAQVRIGDRRFPTVGAALAAAGPGDQVDLPPARYGSPSERFPLEIPPGVMLAGVAPDDPTADPPTLDGADLAPGTPLVRLADDAGIEGLTLLGPRTAGTDRRRTDPAGATVPHGGERAGEAMPLVIGDGTQRTRVEQCTLHGSLVHRGGADHAVSFNTILGGSVLTVGADRVTVTSNRRGRAADDLPGASPAGVGVEVIGGAEHRIDANTVTGTATGIRLRDGSDATVAANAVNGRHWAVHLAGCHRVDVSGNQCRGGRAVTISGGDGNHVVANVADGTDTGLLLERSAGGTVATANQFVGCRIGILSWSHHDSTLDGNRFAECATNHRH